jgi:hypothetical protein
VPGRYLEMAGVIESKMCTEMKINLLVNSKATMKHEKNRNKVLSFSQPLCICKIPESTIFTEEKRLGIVVADNSYNLIDQGIRCGKARNYVIKRLNMVHP